MIKLLVRPGHTGQMVAVDHGYHAQGRNPGGQLVVQIRQFLIGTGLDKREQQLCAGLVELVDQVRCPVLGAGDRNGAIVRIGNTAGPTTIG